MRRRRLVRFGKFERVAFVDGSSQKDADARDAENAKATAKNNVFVSAWELEAGYLFLAMCCWVSLFACVYHAREQQWSGEEE